MLRERPKSKQKEDPKRQTSLAIKKQVEDDHTHKRSVTAEKPKKKISKKKKAQQERRRLDEQQRRLEELEQQRREELEKLRLQELKKLTKEETERLSKQFPQYYEKCRKFEALAMTAARKEKQLKEWELYISESEMIDVDKQKEIHKLISALTQNLQKWINLLDKVQSALSSRLQEAKANRDRQRSFYYKTHLDSIQAVIRQKCEDYIRYNIDNFDRLLEAKNRQLKQRNLPQLSLENQKHIGQIVFKKSEQRYKYEISRVLLNTRSLKLALWFNLIKAGYRPKPLTFPIANMELEVPRMFIQNSVAVACLKHQTHKYGVASEYFCIGDVIELLVLPFFALPRVTPKFTLKRITELEVKDDPQQNNKAVLKRLNFQAKENQRLSVKLALPQNFYLGKDPKLSIGMYVEGQGWTRNFTTNIEVDTKENSIKCDVTRLYPMSILLPKSTDFPYKSFFLRCVSSQTALLDLQTARGIKLAFEIGRSYVKLLHSAKIMQLDYLVDEEMSSGELVKQLKDRGIMISASDEDTDYVQKSKIPEVENKIIEDLGFSISGFAFKNSVFNAQASPTEIVVQAKSHLGFETRDIHDDLNPWQTYLFTINKCGLLSNKLKSFKEELEKNTLTHINLEKLVRENPKIATEELLDRFSWANMAPEFILTVKTFVKQTRLFALTSLSE